MLYCCIRISRYIRVSDAEKMGYKSKKEKVEEMRDKQFKISVVIPVYNVELYVAETIESVIKQDIGFEENIQIILVNDGSTDGSERICREYVERYPENIQYVYQENAGVSVARNTGMDYVKGKYVNFLDSDDKWSLDAFSKVYDFFEAHEGEINVVACRMIFFEARTEAHYLSRGEKFAKDRVINILDDYQYVQLHAASTFIKTDAMKIATFDSSLKYGEDALYISQLIIDKNKYGVVSEPIYHYRKRINQSSALQGKKSLDWYQATLEKFHKRLIKLSLDKWGIVIPYIQYMLCYDIQWKVNDKIHFDLTEEQRKRYIEDIKGILTQCEDDIILKQQYMNNKKKLFLLSLKYNEDVFGRVECHNSKLYFDNIQIFNLQRNTLFRVDVIEIKDKWLCLSGKIDFNFTDELNFFFIDNQGKKYPVTLVKLEGAETKIWNKKVSDTYFYDITIDVSKIKWLEIRAVFREDYLFRPKIVCGKFSKLYNFDMKSDYYVQGNYMITRDLCRIYITACNRETEKKQEQCFCEELKGLEIDEDMKKEALWYRKRYFHARLMHRKKIWLISDRINVAGDNGEIFFKYMAKKRPANIEFYFVISKESKDYMRMKKIGKVIPYGSKKCKLYTLLADKIISSQGEDNIINPFYDLKPYVGNLYHYDYVFLQHGIIKDDISTWLNKLNKNIRIFVTSAKPEYQSVLDFPYMYGEDVVKLTGLPRYDNLIQDIPCKKEIVFMPTWRKELTSEMNPITGIRPYNPVFQNSEYFQFYNKLINDERIKDVMKKNGYKGKFCIHTNNITNACDFQGNDVIEVSTDIVDYQKEFKKNALLITDYSSVAYDFAYLKKPVIYAQIDRKAFFASHTYDVGYWDYEQMGFGPVCYDYESTVNAIVNAVRNNCRLDEKYLRRIEQFYFKFDQNNCERVYQAIGEIGE